MKNRPRSVRFFGKKGNLWCIEIIEALKVNIVALARRRCLQNPLNEPSNVCNRT